LNEEEEDPAAKDRIIQGTDSDALGSRISAVNAGYLQDPYIKYFHTDEEPPTRFPVINRGRLNRMINEQQDN
jgi:[phosphatase 2A protein]-leucine-carboxy methyltransferase